MSSPTRGIDSLSSSSGMPYSSSSARAAAIRGSSRSPPFPCEDSAVSTLAAMKRGCDVGCNPQSCADAAPPQQRRETHPSGPTNVGELVGKAKKAAASLWMILHAQNCRISDGSCPHRGCSETKLLLVHVKCCPAGPTCQCPSQTRGCNETRKLLAHYRRCKDMRMKQVGLGRRSGMQPDQSCLVCSLMARYAKGMMDRSNSKAKNLGSTCQGKNHVPSLLCSPSLEGKKFNVERGMAGLSTNVSPVGAPRRTLSGMLMPPPPPRLRPSAIQITSTSNESFPSPPNSTQNFDPSLLCTSVDSNVRVPFPILKRPAREVRTMSEGDGGLVVPASPRSRQRAVSYDERKSRVQFAPVVRRRYFDPREEGVVDEPQPLGYTDGGNDGAVGGRPRSNSCGNVGLESAAAASLGCETIEEEGVPERVDDPVFRMD